MLLRLSEAERHALKAAPGHRLGAQLVVKLDGGVGLSLAVVLHAAASGSHGN